MPYLEHIISFSGFDFIRAILQVSNLWTANSKNSFFTQMLIFCSKSSTDLRWEELVWPSFLYWFHFHFTLVCIYIYPFNSSLSWLKHLTYLTHLSNNKLNNIFIIINIFFTSIEVIFLSFCKLAWDQRKPRHTLSSPITL